MKSPTLAILFLVAPLLAAPATAGTLAGAADGQYRAQDGSFILVDSAANSIGIQLLDCAKPVVVAGRMKSGACMANGHDGGSVDVSWRTERGMIFADGRSYAPMPKLAPPPVVGPPDKFEPSTDSWDHNGSLMDVDPKTGVISYLAPKASLKGVAKKGSIVYKGDLKPGRMILGTAYAFKDGCPPASYPVRGVYTNHNELLTLTGPGPKREGCEVVAYDYAAPHSTLVFKYVYGD